MEADYYRYVKVSFSFSKRCICTDVKYIHQQGFSIAREEKRGVGETQGLGEYNIVQTGAQSQPTTGQTVRAGPCRCSATAAWEKVSVQNLVWRPSGEARFSADRVASLGGAECSEQTEESGEPPLTHPPASELRKVNGPSPLQVKCFCGLAQGGRSKKFSTPKSRPGHLQHSTQKNIITSHC